MFDLWAFLLQTLNVSGVAALILIVKALFKDKLPPKWQFASWSVLGIMILLPAGIFGTYTLLRWQTVVEIIKSEFGEYGFTRVRFPFPIVKSMPQTVFDWLFVLYTMGVAVSLIGYLIAYLRLKRILRLGEVPSNEISVRIHALAAEHEIKPCHVICVEDLPSAFVFGIFHPILVIPNQHNIDDKVILHEFFHLKNKDTIWSMVICILRSVHWCNPLIVYCANRALNDMESRCDQYVLESVVGEKRREYGNILLSMTNERFSKTPGSTSIHNGGKNIRARIENIARFKKYPKGMKLVSACVLIVLAFSLFTGVRATSILEFSNSPRWTLASARSTPCTTYAGAFDAYGKAILDRNGYYRAMCTPEQMQKDLETEILENDRTGKSPNWNPGLNEWANEEKGYYIYNLTETEKNVYEGLFVVELNYPPDGKPEEIGVKYLTVQNLRVQKENGRWITTPLEDFRYIETRYSHIEWGCIELPGLIYTGKADDFRIDIKFQTVYTVDSTVTNSSELGFLTDTHYETIPNPHAKFNFATWNRNAYCIYLGDESEKDNITYLGFSYSPVYEGESRPVNPPVSSEKLGSSSANTGLGWSSMILSPGWDSEIELNGSGSGVDPARETVFPQYYAIDFYINSKKITVDLYPTKGGDHP